MIRTMSCLSPNSTNQTPVLCHPGFIKAYVTLSTNHPS